MLIVYYPYFIMVLILIAVLFVIVFTRFTSSMFNVAPGSFMETLPIIICCVLFVVPLLKIYLKEPVKKNSMFFEKKLGEEILKINKICAEKNEPLRFFMPEGIEINVEVEYPTDHN